MEKECIMCGKSFAPQRATRKFCSNNCRQMNHYKHCAETLSKSAVKASGLKELSFLEIESDTIVGQLDETAELERTIRKELEMNNELENVSAPLMNIIVKAVLKLFSEKINDSIEKAVKITLNNTNTKQGTPNLVVTSDGIKDLTKKIPVQETPIEYVKINSSFLEEIGELDRTHTDWIVRLNFPKDYWHSSFLDNISWANQCVRTLCDTFLSINKKPFVDKEAIFLVADALKSLKQAILRGYLPKDYPFRQWLFSTESRMDAIAWDNRNSDLIRFRVSREQKIELIFIRYLLLNLTSSIKFSGVNFEYAQD